MFICSPLLFFLYLEICIQHADWEGAMQRCSATGCLGHGGEQHLRACWGKGSLAGELSVVRRKMFVGTEAAPILQEHRCSLRSTAPLAMCAVQPGFPGGGTARRDPERCSVPGTTPGLQPWWDLLAPSTGKSSQG